MAQYPMTIEALHGYVDSLASQDLVSPGFVGPSPRNSRFLGDEPYISEESSPDAAFPVMFRCVYPPDTQSRHAVIHIKLSMSEKALASKLYEVFDLKPTKGIIKSSVVVLIHELWTFTANGPPTLATGAGTQVSTSDFGKTLEVLGSTKSGIVELDVISEKEYTLCPSCGHQGSADAAMLQLVRLRCIDVQRQCIRCLMDLGIPSDAYLVTMPGNIDVHAIRG